MTEKKRLTKFIKDRYPIGSIIYDRTCSEPYTINKRSVFIVSVWTSDMYSDEMRPDDRKDYYVDFLVKNPGRNSRVYDIKSTFLKYTR